jgi:hypothetical protein
MPTPVKLSVLDTGWRGYEPAFIHSYAACTGGSVLTNLRKVPAGPVLIVLRKTNLRRASAAIDELRKRGSKILIALAGTSSHDIANTLGDTTRWEFFRTICSRCDLALAQVEDLVPFFNKAGSPRTEFLPIPIDFESAPAPKPLAELRGIFVGTREFRIPARRHLEAVTHADSLSRLLQIPLAVLNSEGRDGGMLLKDFQRRNPLFYIIEAPITRSDFLDVLRLHRIVWQLDTTSAPGRIASDSILCGLPCVGGNGTAERLAFPAVCGPRPAPQLLESAERLLTDDAFWSETVGFSREKTLAELAYGAVSARISALLG